LNITTTTRNRCVNVRNYYTSGKFIKESSHLSAINYYCGRSSGALVAGEEGKTIGQNIVKY